MIELLLRIIGFSAPRFYQVDPILGHKFIPGAKGWFQQEGNAYITINSEGWRDNERSKAKPENTIRIAVLGDSYAEALQIPIEDTFWAIMENKINTEKCMRDKTVEVLNFGVSGYGTAQELLTLQHYAWEYFPDIVLLAFLTGNDIRNNSKTLEPRKNRPFFLFQGDTLELDSSLVMEQKTYRFQSLRQTLHRQLRIYQLLSKLKKLYRSSGKVNDNNTIQGEELGLDNMVYVEQENPEWQEAWKITEALLVKMHNEVKRNNKRFVVIILSNSIQVHPDSEMRKQFMEDMKITTLFYPDMRIQTFLEKHGIEVITLAPIFHNYAEQHNIFLHGFENSELGFGHWNTYGHRLAGETIAAYFCSKNE